MNNNHTFLIQQVINDLLDIRISLEGALLKLNYFSRLVKNDPLLKFTEKEINGYKDFIPPKYRWTIAKLTVLVEDNYNPSREIELPISQLEKPFNKELKYIKMREGIRVIESISKKTGVDNVSSIGTPIPLEMMSYIKKALNKTYPLLTMAPTKAIVRGNPTLAMQISSTVRYRLLAFATEIAQKFSYEIEIDDYKKNLNSNNQIINNYIKNHITNNGNHNVVNTGKDSTLAIQNFSHNKP